jgi:hypothetical protein
MSMVKKRRWLIPTLSVAVLAVCLAVLVQHKPMVFYAACEIGLPNATLPAALSSKDVGCAILGKKRTYTGIVMTGSEAQNFHLETGENAWLRCPKDGCGKALEHQFGISTSASCPHSRATARIAYTEIEGWMASYPGHFGHLNAFTHEFFASRIIKVGPPPGSFIRQIERKLQEHDACA